MDERRRYDADRREREPWRNWYKLAVWQKARARRLAIEPLCRRCASSGVVSAAAVVNHIKPHRGDWALFCDTDNHESLCKRCHDGVVQSEERQG